MRTYQGKKTGKGRRDWKRPASCILRRQPTPVGTLQYAPRCLLCATHLQFSNSRMPGYHLELLLKCRSRDSPGGPVVRSPPANARRPQRRRFDPWVGKVPWRRAWQLTPVFLPRESHGQRTLAGYSQQGLKELDSTKHERISR